MATLTLQSENPRARNNLRHGLRSRMLPFKGGKTISKYRNAYRRALEDRLLSQGREIGPFEASCIAAATGWYCHALKAGFWLDRSYSELEPEQRLTFSREEARGLEYMTKMAEKLGLAEEAGDDLFYPYLPEPRERSDTETAAESNGSEITNAPPDGG